jgi:hypothetical protein
VSALLALALAALGATGFTIACWGLYLVTDPEVWGGIARRWRYGVTSKLRRYARRTHLHGQKHRSDIAWKLADLLTSTGSDARLN